MERRPFEERAVPLVNAGIITSRRELSQVMTELLKAHEYSQIEAVDRVVYAVLWAELERVAGVTSTDMLFLERNGLIERCPVPVNAEMKPVTMLDGNRWGPHSHYVLTDKGVMLAMTALRPATSVNLAATATQPKYHSELRELRFGRHVIKRFREPAENQERVLIAFEEEGWPRRILDPLPPSSDTAPKTRLADTIRNLNKRQQVHVIRFAGDGHGEGVMWRLVAEV